MTTKRVLRKLSQRLLFATALMVLGCDEQTSQQTIIRVSPEPDSGRHQPRDAQLDATVADAEVVYVDASKDSSKHDTAAFRWPLFGWVAASHELHDGGDHDGTADIAAPFWTPVTAARGGRVSRSGWSNTDGYRVTIDHEMGYRTLYTHLGAQPLPAVGDEVESGQTIGYAGSTGARHVPGSHVHFAIQKDGGSIRLPSLKRGVWLRQGAPIEGDFTPLLEDAFDAHALTVRSIDASTPLYAQAEAQATTVSTLGTGTFDVTDTQDGFYRVTTRDGTGWVPHSATVPEGSSLTFARITADINAFVRSGPTTDAPIVAKLPRNTLVTAFEVERGWNKILVDEVSALGYVWVYESNLQKTDEFRATIHTPFAAVRATAHIGAEQVAELRRGDTVTVLEVRSGWYRFARGSVAGWFPGWTTAGPR